MALAKAGSVDAFGELYARYCDRAYRLARSICRDDGHAEDAVQDAFASLWKSRASYLPQRGTVAAWLLTAVRYRAIDVFRRHHRHAHRRAGEDALGNHPLPEDLTELSVSRERARDLQRLLRGLPAAQREVIALAFYGELSHTEIATALALPTGTIKGRMRLGLHKLRADIDRVAA
jgi:RNA polymerase sigma-70 factor, ECF subfamily